MHDLGILRHLFVTLLAAAISLIEVHGPEGQIYFVNPQQITSLRAPIAADLRQFAHGTHCIIVTTAGAGRFLAVRETCAEITLLIGLAPY